MNMTRPAWIITFVLLLLAPAIPPMAVEKTPTLSPKTYRVLQDAEKLLDRGKSGEAIQRLEQLIRETAEDPYAQAVACQALAHAHIDLGDYPAAIPPLERSLDLQALPHEAQRRSRYNLAQLYLANERFSAAVEQLKIWFEETEKPGADAYVLLGSAYLQLNQFKNAISPLRRAIAISEKPNETWYQSLLGAYNELQDYPACVELLQRMLKLFPDRPDYWRQLSAIELMRKNNRQALAAMELGYLNGQLTGERDLLNLAQLYSLLDIPYKAAQLLEKEINQGRIEDTAKHWEQTADAWYRAKEMDASIAAYAKAVARGGDSGLRLRLAQLYLEERQWSKARKRLLEVIESKETKWRDRGWLLLGIACFEENALEQARSAFSEALKFAKTRQQAAQWLTYLDQQT